VTGLKGWSGESSISGFSSVSVVSSPGSLSSLSGLARSVLLSTSSRLQNILPQDCPYQYQSFIKIHFVDISGRFLIASVSSSTVRSARGVGGSELTMKPS